MDIRLNDLKNFTEACGCTTFTQAAKKLEISQPALSESMKRLESDLGVVLFYRSRNGIQLTPSGRMFLGRAQSVFQSIQDLKFTDSTSASFEGRSISIGCHSTVASYLIPKALSFIKKTAPDYKVALMHDLSRNIQSAVQKGMIDVGIVVNPVLVPDLIVSHLAFDTVGVWTSKSNDGMDAIVCDLDLFQTQSILKKWKNKPEKIISSSSLSLIAQMVNEKIGYGILPERAVEQSQLKLKKVHSTPVFRDEICLVYRPEFGKKPFERLVIESLKTQF